MNVTVDLDDRLLKVARHHAGDSGVSLSVWLALLIEREVSDKEGSKLRAVRLLDALGDESVAALEFGPPHLLDEPQGAVFEP